MYYVHLYVYQLQPVQFMEVWSKIALRSSLGKMAHIITQGRTQKE